VSATGHETCSFHFTQLLNKITICVVHSHGQMR
jgi:hypothetical protein